MTNTLNFRQEDVDGHNPGDVIKINGLNYKLEKSTGRNILVRRYYWFDALWDKLTTKS